METKCQIFISPKYKKEEYKKLGLTENSKQNDWDTAIDIFKDRIDGRFIEPIKELSYDWDKNGFAIMALNCLLIETFLQFYKGEDETTGNNKDEYSGFLRSQFPNFFVDQSMAEKFYVRIRCGILHSAQTKKGARLTYNEAYPVKVTNGMLMVSVDKFSDVLKNYFDDYVAKLKVGNDSFLRKNFITKMDFICNK